MTEDFLHYLWKFQKLEKASYKTVTGEALQIHQVGTHNINNSGPDFFNAIVTIGNQKWAGNIEIHKKSSNWYEHQHQNDKAYDNVILHIVWEDDVEIFRKDQTLLPTLQLKDYVSEHLVKKYLKLFENFNQQGWLHCHKQIKSVDDFTLSLWKDRLYLERLEKKTDEIQILLQASKNNWEAVMFQMLMQNFGLKANKSAFTSIAKSFSFNDFRKCTDQLLQTEALLFGQAGLLEKEYEDTYFQHLKREYIYLKNKFNLNRSGVLPLDFFRVRPSNFPTIRLAQLSSLYYHQKQLFAEAMQITTFNEFTDLFTMEISEYWKMHYTFEKQSKKRNKTFSRSFLDLIFINTIIPLKFLHARMRGKDINEGILNMISEVKKEQNAIIDTFENSGIKIVSALDSQALLELKNNYCVKKACLQCGIGNKLMTSSSKIQE